MPQAREELRCRIIKLRAVRDALLKQPPPKKKGTRRKSAPKKLVFKSKELEDIFNSMPPECKRVILEGR